MAKTTQQQNRDNRNHYLASLYQYAFRNPSGRNNRIITLRQHIDGEKGITAFDANVLVKAGHAGITVTPSGVASITEYEKGSKNWIGNRVLTSRIGTTVSELPIRGHINYEVVRSLRNKLTHRQLKAL